MRQDVNVKIELMNLSFIQCTHVLFQMYTILLLCDEIGRAFLKSNEVFEALQLTMVWVLKHHPPHAFYCPTAAYISSYTFPTQPSILPPLATTPKPPAAHTRETTIAVPLTHNQIRLLRFLLLTSSAR